MAVTLNVGLPNPLEIKLTPWIVRKTQEGVPNGMGGYTDVEGEAADQAAFLGQLVEGEPRTDPTRMGSQGEIAVTRHIVIFDFTPDELGLENSDRLVEGQETEPGSGEAEPKPGGKILEVTNIREYDYNVQVDVKFPEE